MVYFCPLFEDDVGIFYLHSLGGEIYSIKDLYTLTGVVPAGASYGDELDEIIANNLKTAQFKDNFAMLGAIVKKRFDFAILARLDGQAHLSRMGMEEQILMSPFSLATNSVHLSFSRKSPCAEKFQQFNLSVKSVNLDTAAMQQLLLSARNVYFNEINWQQN